MVLCEDGECSVCLSAYSRMDRIPRVLHCRHTFCEPCLETISRLHGGLLTVACPLCRRVTCISRERSLQEALWVNTQIWDRIPDQLDAEGQPDETEGDGVRQKAEEEGMKAKQRPSLQAECVSSRSARPKIRLPAFFRKFSLTKEHQEIVPGSTVEMKSWRRLSTDEIF
ncbi:uncharacterized protein ACNS7B_004369 [Menidia menidia]